ncbi:MAG: OadG family protein [Porticoccaceae bacterium]|nr:OadG family protein [Porticoccaceae bacterium]
MDSSLIAQGVDLLIYGMGTVFTFLTLLVGITSLMSSLVNRIADDEAEAMPEGSSPIVSASVEPRIARVIQAAIDLHRGKKK